MGLFDTVLIKMPLPDDAPEFVKKCPVFQTYDLGRGMGEYFIDELDKDLGSSNFGNVAYNKGIGAFLDHARNELQANVTSVEHKGSYVQSKYNFKWGIKAQHESISDNIDEWQYRDSADFSIVHPPDNPGDSVTFSQQIVLNNVVKNKINLTSFENLKNA